MDSTLDAYQTLALDHNGQLPMRTELGPVNGDRVRDVKLTIDLSSLARPSNLGGKGGHFQNGFKLVTMAYGHREEIDLDMHYTSTAKGKAELECQGIINADAQDITLELYGQPLVHLVQDRSDLIENPDPALKMHRLFVDELRLIADSEVKPNGLPVDRGLFDGFDPTLHAPITELHTHSSAQLSGADLIALGIKHGISYPTELLTEKLGMVLTEEERSAITTGKSLLFKPGERDGLQCEKDNQPCEVIPIASLTPEHRQQLQDYMRVPQDMTLAFTDFDRRYYRFVNPIVKHPDIAKDLMLNIARAFKKNGVKYAELSTSAMLNLDSNGEASWFKAAIEGIDAAKKETGVDLRFLISIPREYTLVKMLAECEKIKYAARHPYVVGWDLVGFEQKPASELAPIVAHMADWARAPEGTELPADKDSGYNFQEDFVHRFHGGETEKKYGNVADSVSVAREFGVPVRNAHALHEAENYRLDELITQLSDKPLALFGIEFCGPSNIAYSNIKRFPKAAFERWLKCCKHWFLGADGAGSIQTNPIQLALSALASGVTVPQLAQMRQNEEAFVELKQKQCERKRGAFETLYAADMPKTQETSGFHDQTAWQYANDKFLQGLAKNIDGIKKTAAQNVADPINPLLPEAFNGKTPVLVAGASKESFENLTPTQRENAKRTVRMLVATLDPKKVYFVLGRTKREGITGVLDEAILEYNKEHPENKFKVLGLSTQDTHEMPRSISWIVPQKGQIDQVPDNIMDFMHARHKETGEALNIFISGANFTGYMIKKCRDQDDMPYLLMSNAGGASQEAGHQVRDDRKFKDGQSLIERIDSLELDLFPKGLDVQNHEILKEIWDCTKRHQPKAPSSNRPLERSWGVAPRIYDGPPVR